MRPKASNKQKENVERRFKKSKYTIRNIIILILITLFLPPAISQDILSRDKLVEDIRYYADSLVAKHKNPFTKLSKKEFELRIDQLLQTPVLTYNNTLIELMKINALIGDEHSSIFPSFQTFFPFECEVFDEGIAITVIDSVHQQYLLHRIIAIDNTPVKAMMEKFKAIIKQDNPSFVKFFLTILLNKTTILQGLGIIHSEKQASFTMLSPHGDTVSIAMASINLKDAQSRKWVSPEQQKNLLAFQSNSNYWYKLDKQKDVLYFNYMRCAESKIKPFETFRKELFDVIRTEKPGKIILDLRFNAGGNSSILDPFIDDIKKNTLNKRNSFFVLIGKKVFSSSILNAVRLKRETKAIFIGEATGGSINHFGEVRFFTLPNTKTTITYSTKYWENWKNHHGSFKPDIAVPDSYFDFIKAYDRALETAIAQ